MQWSIHKFITSIRLTSPWCATRPISDFWSLSRVHVKTSSNSAADAPERSIERRKFNPISKLSIRAGNCRRRHLGRAAIARTVFALRMIGPALKGLELLARRWYRTMRIYGITFGSIASGTSLSNDLVLFNQYSRDVSETEGNTDW